MASTLSDDFEKMNIKAKTATTTDVVEGVPCAACGKEMAQKKCKKRHGGCTEKRFCDSVCDRKKHEEEKMKKGNGEEEEENVDTAGGAKIDDAAIAKMKRKEDRKIRKKLSRKGLWAADMEQGIGSTRGLDWVYRVY